MILEEKISVWQTRKSVANQTKPKFVKSTEIKKKSKKTKPKPVVQKKKVIFEKLVGPNMVPQHGHDLQLVVSQQQTDLMDTTAGGVQQIQQQQQQISNMNHALQQQNMLESVLQSQVVVNNDQQQMMGQQQISPVLFGSQMVDKNSSTPYTDATQVSVTVPASK